MIENLKRAMGAGARTNKYLLELAWGDLDSAKLNVLCKAAALPEVKISTVTAGYHGRHLVLRGEAEFPETYEITIYDDASMSLRQFFCRWMLAIDDPGKYKTKLHDGSIGGNTGFIGQLINDASSVIDEIEENLNDLKDLPGRIEQTATDWLYGYVGMTAPSAGMMEFAAPLRIWMLDGSGNKVHGCEFENAYPVTLGQVELGADKQDEVVEYSVTLAFSDFFIIK